MDLIKWLGDREKVVFVRDHPEIFPEALEHVQAFITSCLQSVKIDPGRNPSLLVEDYDEWRWIAVGFLWEALQRYDPMKGAPMTFLYPTIKGKLQRTVRETATPVKVTRREYFSGIVARQVSMDTPGLENTIPLSETLESPTNFFKPIEDALSHRSFEDFLATLRPLPKIVMEKRIHGETSREISQWLGISIQQVNLLIRHAEQAYAAWEQLETY